MNEISKYYNSFSGTDTLVFMLLPNTPPITLGAITTLSYSIYRDKKPITTVGNINVKGFTRGTRVVAGTMIFTLINKHWVNDVIDQCEWLKGYDSLKADELPMFDIMIVSANEYGASASMFIYGVDVTDEAQTLSIEDMFTENQFSFIARNVDTFQEGSMTGGKIGFRSNKELSTYDDWTISTSSVSSELLDALPVNDATTNAVQQYLRDNGYDVPFVNGIMDKDTEDKIAEFQYANQLNVTGFMDRDTYMMMFDNKLGTPTDPTYTSNKNGAVLFEEASTESNVVLQLPYNTKLVVLDRIGDEWYKTTVGYVRISDTTDASAETEIDENSGLPTYMTSTVETGMVKVVSDPTDISGQEVTAFLNDFVLTFASPEDRTLTLDICSYFSNGHVNKEKSLIQLNAGVNKTINMSVHMGYFIYNDTEKSFPSMVEIILQESETKVYKWIIRY